MFKKLIPAASALIIAVGLSSAAWAANMPAKAGPVATAGAAVSQSEAKHAVKAVRKAPTRRAARRTVRHARHVARKEKRTAAHTVRHEKRTATRRVPAKKRLETAKQAAHK